MPPHASTRQDVIRGGVLLQYSITAVPDRAHHTLTVVRVELDRHGVRLKDNHDGFGHRHWLMADILRRIDRHVAASRAPKYVWGSTTSTRSVLLKQRDVVDEKMICASELCMAECMASARRPNCGFKASCKVSVSIITVSSVCASKECTHKTISRNVCSCCAVAVVPAAAAAAADCSHSVA